MTISSINIFLSSAFIVTGKLMHSVSGGARELVARALTGVVLLELLATADVRKAALVGLELDPEPEHPD
ncbi:hypothetical protein L1987_33057 [Smallanthus sonchifolius]|uniref:Uncharacterized protein n=1 Tax=Smallanthus sonchifolius TaxID=185202 RepID=A0ACB9HPZ2_9ASTR|nr:hypothetical protein L1987_33057 [Smallanthus sonchifolius]